MLYRFARNFNDYFRPRYRGDPTTVTNFEIYTNKRRGNAIKNAKKFTIPERPSGIGNEMEKTPRIRKTIKLNRRNRKDFDELTCDVSEDYVIMSCRHRGKHFSL